MNSGYSVPNSTAATEATIMTLLAKSIDSRENQVKAPPATMRGERQANKASEPPTTTSMKPKMNAPRSGSTANACTEDSTPDRTKKVPNSESEKVMSASSTVQALKAPRFSATAKEWIKAVPANQGMKDAFSTGSQNHQPPHPSSR